MRILLTNDDGIHAPGLAALEKIAHALTDDVWVVAPELDQSGLSHSLSLNDPLRLREVGEKKFAVRGTPSDCVIMGLRRILANGKPDLVLSGVNSGTNIADDVTYSGTIAGAIEGTMLGVPAIALSQGYPVGERTRIPYETSVEHGPRVVQALIDFGFHDNILYNVNFPNRAPERVEGVKIAAQGRMAHGLHVEERFDGRGNQYFWLAYRKNDGGAAAPGSDIEAIGEGFISVTALRLDLTAHDLAEPLRHHFARRG